MSPQGFESLVLFFARGLVSDPARVSVKREGQVILTRAASEDVGRLVGRSGKHIQALRTLVRAAAGRLEGRASPLAGRSEGSYRGMGRREATWSVEIAE